MNIVLSLGNDVGHEFNGFRTPFQHAFLLGPGRGECRVAGAVGLERASRPIPMGSNWLFAGSLRSGSQRAAGVIRSAKLIGGHSDLLAGVATTRDHSLCQALRNHRELAGATPGTLEAFLAVRGARTLALRLHRSQQTAMALAQWLEKHPLVAHVRCPRLGSHPTHAVAKRVLQGFGNIISCDVVGGAEVAEAVCRRTRLIRHATSLGGVESTMERRAAV